MVIRVTAQGTTRVHRITSPGTTIVKTITVGTPSITGTASVGTLSGLDDVSTTGRQDGYLISWDSDTSNHVYTNLDASVRQQISVQDLGGDGSLAYFEETGVIAYTGPTAAETRTHLSATNSITYDSSSGNFDFNFDSAINNVKTHIVPISNENIDLGDSNYKFRDLWLKGTTIHLGSITVNDSTGTFTVKDSAGAIAPLNLAGNTTTDLAEGSNLYYTDTRARASITVNTDNTGQITYDSSTGTFTFTDSNFARTDIQDVFHEGLTIPDTKKIVFCDNVADIFETGGNFFIRRTNNDLPGESGGNIYLMTKDSGFFYIKSYDGDRDLAHFHDNGPVQLYYANSLKLATTDSGVSVTGNTRISGNLTVEGTTTTISSSELVVGDKNIVLADSAPDGVAADGGGITLNGANATILYTNATDTWDFNKAFGTTTNVLSNYTTSELGEGTNLYYTKARWDSALTTVSTTDLAEGTNLYYTTARFDSDLLNNSTTNLPEGTNLYYTRSRFDSALSSTTAIATIRNQFSAGGDLNYIPGIGEFSFNLSDYTTDSVSEGSSNLYYTTARFDSDFGDNTTTELTEGTNLYYTTTRADSDFDVRLATKTTTNLAEGSNLYYTTARADSDARHAISTSGDLTYDPDTGIMSIDVEQVYSFDNFDSDFRQRLTTTTTDSIGEGSNLYYTTARADSDARYAIAVSDLGGDGSLSYVPSTGVLTYTGPSAAEVRAHFSGSGDLSYDSSTGIFSIDVSNIYSKAEFDSDLGDANTDLLPEGSTNLYYTTARADSDFDIRLATKSTSNLTEGTNLYYTSARFDSDFGDKTTDDLTEGSTNLYYTNARFDSDLLNTSTTGLPEGTNLYYTTARADSDAKRALTGGTSIVYTEATGTIATVQGIDSTDDVKFNTITNKDGTTTATPTEVVITGSGLNVLDEFAHNTSPQSFEYLIHLFDSTNTATQITKMLGTFDGTNIASNEFGTVFTGLDYMGELDFDLNSGNIRLVYTKEAGLGTVRAKAIKTIIS